MNKALPHLDLYNEGQVGTATNSINSSFHSSFPILTVILNLNMMRDSTQPALRPHFNDFIISRSEYLGSWRALHENSVKIWYEGDEEDGPQSSNS